MWTAAGFLFYTVVGFFLLPPIVRVIAVKQLSKHSSCWSVLVMAVPSSLAVDLLGLVPKLTVFKLSSSPPDICSWNPLLELPGTAGNSVSEVF